MKAYVADLSSRRGCKYKIEDHGVDNSGKLLADKDVNTNADFLLITPDGRKHKIEIKFCRPDVDKFHLKVGQLNSYIKQDSCIVMFKSINDAKIAYCIIKPKEMAKLLDTCKRITLWGKQQIQVLTKDFTWYSVPPVIVNDTSKL